MKSRLAFALAALVSLASIAAHADFAPVLDPSTLARVIVSGGFMPPGMANTTTYTVKSNGDVLRATYRRGDLTPGQQDETVIGKLGALEQQTLERAIARVHAGKLVDLDPSSPTGADAPNVSYQVNKDGLALEVALRSGNFHNYALKNQRAALVIRQILEKAIRK